MVLVTPLTTMAVAERARETVVPSMVRAGPPGFSVWPEMTNWELELGVRVWCPIVTGMRTGASVIWL